MTERRPPVEVVQCPKCGSPVADARPGSVTSCTYCGATLRVTAGASGYAIASLAGIETSTTYLARIEALKQMREQLAEQERALAEQEEALGRWRAYCAEKWRTEVVFPPTLALGLGLVGVLLALAAFATGERVEELAVLVALCALAAVLFGVNHGRRKKSAAAWLEGAKQKEAEYLDATNRQRAECERLQQRIAEMQAKLREGAERL